MEDRSQLAAFEVQFDHSPKPPTPSLVCSLPLLAIFPNPYYAHTSHKKALRQTYPRH